MGRVRVLILILLSLIMLSGLVYAHSGRTNKSGCHNNRKTGGYHCHGGSSRSSGSSSYKSKYTTPKTVVPESNPSYNTNIDLNTLYDSGSSSSRTVKRIIDGDTVVLDGEEIVRLIGVDCYELDDVNNGNLALKSFVFISDLVTGRQVKLEYDKTKKDRYGRTLAYLFLNDGRHVNAEIIKQGACKAYTKYKFVHMDYFLLLQEVAETNKVGVWAD